jgi:hypothetical protein
MEKTTVENLSQQKGDLMSDQILLEKEKMAAENSTGAAVKTEDGSAACPMQGSGWLKGSLGMAICCGAPLLLFAAIAFFGLSLGAIASGALSLVAVLACPVGMFLMMRMMMKGSKEDQSPKK